MGWPTSSSNDSIRVRISVIESGLGHKWLGAVNSFWSQMIINLMSLPLLTTLGAMCSAAACKIHEVIKMAVGGVSGKSRLDWHIDYGNRNSDYSVLT